MDPKPTTENRALLKEVIDAIADGSAKACYTKCWSCNLGQCPGGWHQWADEDDVAHAKATGQKDPSGQICGCPCAEGPELHPEPEEPDHDYEPHRVDPGPLPDEVYEPLTRPCTVCGEAGPCGYDAEGRPMIHTEEADEDE